MTHRVSHSIANSQVPQKVLPADENNFIKIYLVLTRHHAVLCFRGVPLEPANRLRRRTKFCTPSLFVGCVHQQEAKGQGKLPQVQQQVPEDDRRLACKGGAAQHLDAVNFRVVDEAALNALLNMIRGQEIER